MRRHGILIIGGGLIGLATAYGLLDQDEDVVVIDPQPEVGRGASRANGGLVTPALSDPWNSPNAHRQLAGALLGLNPAMHVRWGQLRSLMSWGTRFLRHSTQARCAISTLASFQLAQFSAIELARARDAAALDTACWQRGSMALFTIRADLRARQALSAELARHGLRFEAFSPSQVIAREPLLAAIEGTLAGGLWYPDDQSADSAALCRALAAHVSRRGVAIRLNCGLLELCHDRGGVSARLSDGTQLRPMHIIIAAGAHSAALVANLDITLPVAPAKGYSLTICLAGSGARPTCPVYDAASHIAYTPLMDTLRVAGVAEFSGFDLTHDPATLSRMLGSARKTYPTLPIPEDIALACPWTGQRPVSADGLPYIGASPVPGLWLNTGHGALGLTHAMGSGALLADLIKRRPPRIDPRPYGCTGRT